MSQCIHRDEGQNSILGRYELAGHDNAGRLVFTGTISLISLKQNLVEGQCTIVTHEPAPEGLFEKNGICEGLMDGNKLSMDMAPYLDDAGLLLEGQFDKARISGMWMLDGFVTSEPLGKFDAVKKN